VFRRCCSIVLRARRSGYETAITMTTTTAPSPPDLAAIKERPQATNPPAGLRSPALRGTEARLKELFPGQWVQATTQTFTFRDRSAAHWLDVFRTWYGPTNRTSAALDTAGQIALEADLLALAGEHNRGGPDALIVPSPYLEAVIMKA
jgi:hypothetical protein